MSQALAGGFLGDGPLVKGGALHEVVEGLVGRRLGGEQEVAACRRDGHGNRLAGEKVVAEVDRPQALQALAVGGQPALGGIALAVLFLGPVLGGDELRHQGQRHGVARCDGRGGQHGMVAFRFAVGAFARQALRAGKLLRAEVLRAVEGDQHAPAEPPEGRQGAPPVQHVEGLVEDRLQVRRMHRVEHRPNVVVGRDRRHAEQSSAVRRRAHRLQAALVGQERLRLHEEQRKGRHPDVGHAVAHVAAPLVRGSLKFGSVNQFTERPQIRSLLRAGCTLRVAESQIMGRDELDLRLSWHKRTRRIALVALGVHEADPSRPSSRKL